MILLWFETSLAFVSDFTNKLENIKIVRHKT